MKKTNTLIRKFDPEILKKRSLGVNSPAILIISKKQTDSITLIKNLMSKMDIPSVVCMSSKEGGDGFYSDYRSDIVEELINTQIEKSKKYREEGIYHYNRPDLRACLVIDECGYDRSLFYQKEINSLFMNGRHWNTSVIMGTQYLINIPREICDFVEYVFCFRDNIISSQQRLYDSYFNMTFDTFLDFQELFNEYTKDYDCIIFDNTSYSNKIEDCVLYYKID